MTDLSETLARYRLPMTRDHIKIARNYLAPVLRYAPRNPLFLAGALLLGVAGALAWRNRVAIAETAGPLVEDARAKGHALVDEALAKAHDLMEDARATGATLRDKATKLRRGDAGRDAVSNVC